MNTISIKSYYHETRTYTPEEYIRFRLLDSPSHAKYINRFAKNVGVTKAELKDLAIKKYDICNIKSNSTKEEILNKLLEKEDIYVLANICKIGVKWFQYAETFGLSLNQVIKFECVGFLNAIDHDINNYMQKEGIYDIKQFADMTKEKIDEAIKKYGIHKEQYDICIDTINGSFELTKEIMQIQEDKEGRFKDIEEFADDPEGYMKRHSEQ